MDLRSLLTFLTGAEMDPRYAEWRRRRRSGWAQSGQLIIGNAQKTVTASADLEEPRQFSVQIDVGTPTTPPAASGLQRQDDMPPGAALSNGGAFCQAAISMTVNGNTFTRTIDVVGGISISGLAESIRVIVSDVTPKTLNGHAMPLGAVYPVTILIGKDSRATTAIAPIQTALRSTAVGGGGNTGVIAVPAGANGVIVYGVLSAGGVPSLELQQNTTSLIGTETLFDSQITTGQTVPLIAGTTSIKVINNGAAANITVVFTMDG